MDALEILTAQEKFDVAILDMHMPEMDGIELANSIPSLAHRRSLPLIMLSSIGQRDDANGLFTAVLTKPAKETRLFDALSALFGAGSNVKARTAPIDTTLGSRHPLRILLAEDNVINQKVALKILERMGYQADVANNGKEAVDAVARRNYDVVLMDVQMPEMDGLEAARSICERWQPGERPRIVAMTANAMQGDRDLCLAAGMDDYLTKPIRVERLVEALTLAQVRGDH